VEKAQHLTARENWIDTVKIFACVLVVLGHFFQSMVKSDILLDNALHGWFNQTIYYFHVPLFFICSGYLFQKFTQIETFAQWGNNFLKKFISLAVPYFVFSLATYIMKTVFADSVNKESGGLIDALFLNPT
jgi:fucose 4-O-acetylase-like acetyltransferase